MVGSRALTLRFFPNSLLTTMTARIQNSLISTWSAVALEGRNSHATLFEFPYILTTVESNGTGGSLSWIGGSSNFSQRTSQIEWWKKIQWGLKVHHEARTGHWPFEKNSITQGKFPHSIGVPKYISDRFCSFQQYAATRNGITYVVLTLTTRSHDDFEIKIFESEAGGFSGK